MPRIPRLPSSTGLFHVMQRGVNHQELFFEDADRWKFLHILRHLLEESDFILHSTCQMTDHIHLALQKGENADLSDFMHDLDTGYAKYYNRKYDRTGPVFNDRFKSIPIENESYYLSVMHYIAQNPVKAGICEDAADYPWSSLHSFGNKNSLVNTEEVLRMSQMGKDEFIRFLRTPYEGPGYEGESRHLIIPDHEAVRQFFQISGLSSPSEFQRLPDGEKRRIILQMLRMHCSYRQISRVTGMTRWYIKKITTTPGTVVK